MRTPEGHHTTNYADTLITLAADTKATSAVPPPAGKGTVAERQFAMLAGHDYEFTSDDVIFTVHADRAAIPPGERAAARAVFFAKGQPCLRTSPLPKTYGWGIHADAAGRVALVPVGSARYDELLADESTTKTQAMRSSR
ncbi:MAG: hypothetical protein IPK37_18665 [Austwickia sp.]|jgi:hypothetical protein|nr:MAG: hypothetical protein IPK37_18665 [Austwickia sp.]